MEFGQMIINRDLPLKFQMLSVVASDTSICSFSGHTTIVSRYCNRVGTLSLNSEWSKTFGTFYPQAQQACVKCEINTSVTCKLISL